MTSICKAVAEGRTFALPEHEPSARISNASTSLHADTHPVEDAVRIEPSRAPTRLLIILYTCSRFCRPAHSPGCGRVFLVSPSFDLFSLPTPLPFPPSLPFPTSLPPSRLVCADLTCRYGPPRRLGDQGVPCVFVLCWFLPPAPWSTSFTVWSLCSVSLPGSSCMYFIRAADFAAVDAICCSDIRSIRAS